MDKSRFTWNWNTSLLAKDSEKIAREQGVSGASDLDSFRHAYVSAKASEKFGPDTAAALGIANEILSPTKDNWREHILDLRNNETGINIYDEVRAEAAKKAEEKKLSEAQAAQLQEEMLRTRLTDAVRSGQLSLHTLDDVGLKDVLKGILNLF